MAWRDSRRGRWRMLGFSLSVMVGIAALVASGSLRKSLLDAVEREARALLGADIYLHSKRPFSKEAEKLLAGIPARVQRETALTIMASAPGSGDSRLVQARGVDPGFPFYGAPVTDPPDAWKRCLAGEGFVVDPALIEALRSKPGDVIRLGKLEKPLLGTLVKAPPQVSALGVFAPELFLARKLVAATELVGGNDFTFHRAWLQVPAALDVEAHVVKRLKRPLNSAAVSMETVAARKKTIGAVLGALYSFVSLMAFIALALGGLGIASAMRVHARERLPRVATLRCLGATAGQALAVYVAQGTMLGLAGSAGGVLLGLAIQAGAPLLLNRVLPFQLEPGIPWGVAASAMGFGFLICVSFALLPLLSVRRVPALAAVRAKVEGAPGGWRDPLAWVIGVVLVGALTKLAMTLSPPDAPKAGIAFTAGLGGGLLVLALVARLTMWAVRRAVRPWWPFPLRQGLAGLYRPGNQTSLFLLSGGLVTALVLSTLLTQHLLLEKFNSRTLLGKANFYAIDVKSDQRAAVGTKLKALDAPPVDEAPMILTTISEVNGKSQTELREGAENRRRAPNWILNNVYRATWREAPGEGEEVIDGRWVARHDDPDKPVPVSLEEGLAKRLRVKTGDRITLNAGTDKLECEITSLRKVDWEEMRLNFLIVFPAGRAEKLAHTWAVSARLPTPAAGAKVQRELSAAFPNLTIFDIAAAVGILEDILAKAGVVVRGLSLVVVLTGVLILIAVVSAGRQGRTEESVLLRTMGASSGQIRRILTAEYVLLGFLASAAGAGLSTGFSWLLARYLFDVPFTAWLLPLAGAVAVVCGITAALGLLMSRGIATHPPLAILRQET